MNKLKNLMSKVVLPLLLISLILQISIDHATATISNDGLESQTRSNTLLFAPTQITGIVFRDYNANGSQDSKEPGYGETGMTVNAYDDSNNVTSFANVNSDGTFSISDLTDGQKYRLELVGLPSYLESGAYGTDSDTSVQFVSSPADDITFGVNTPSEFCDANPTLVTSCFVFGDQQGANANEPVLVGVPYNADGTSVSKNYMVPAQQMGSTYGIAWQNSSQRLFASSFIKGNSGLGPNASGGTTTGGIYEITDGGGMMATASLFLDLQALGFDTGTDNHPTPSANCYSATNGQVNNHSCWLHDSASLDVGKVGLGDLEFSTDQQTLYATNLYSKTLIIMPVGMPAVAPSATNITAVPVPTTDCSNGDAVPFALKAHNNDLYVGVTCTAETSDLVTDLKAVVYRYSGSFTKVFETSLNYQRDGMVVTHCSTDPGCTTTWEPWHTTIAEFDIFSNRLPLNQQPIFADIEFDGGDLILAIRDRTADMFGSDTGNPENNNDSTLYLGNTAGDILRACDDGAGGWTLENGGICGGVTNGGTNTGHGPGGDEFYLDQYVNGTVRHDELIMGGIAQVPGFDTVATTFFDAYDFDEGLIGTWNNTTGLRATAARLYQGTTNPATFDKANGLGDIEALCAAAPIEVGNRLWNDADGDGVQDPSELPLAGITVNLCDAENGDAIVGTAVTNADGSYYFGGVNNSNMNTVSTTITDTISVYVNASSDDAEQSSGTMYLNISDLYLGSSAGGANTLGFRFNNITIPAGATVTKAYIQFQADESSSGTSQTDTTIYGQDSDNATTFTSTTNNITSRPKTTASMAWAPSGWTNGARGVDQQTPSLTNIVQEIVNRGGWASGNSMAFILETSSGHQEVESYDGLPNGAAELIVEFTTQVTTTTSLLADHDYAVCIDVSQPALAGYALTVAGNTPDSDATNDNHDSDGVMSGNYARAEFSTGKAGENNHSYDFGFALGVAIGNFVWDDTGNPDGVYSNVDDGANAGISGVVVHLFKAGDDPSTATPVLTATTDANGFYEFSNILPDIGYFVSIDPSQTAIAPYDASSPGGGHDPLTTDEDYNTAGGHGDDGFVASFGGASFVISNVFTPTVAGQTSTMQSQDDDPTGWDDDDAYFVIDFGFVDDDTDPTAVSLQNIKVERMPANTPIWFSIGGIILILTASTLWLSRKRKIQL